MKRILTVVLALSWLALPLHSAAQEKFRAASGGFSTAIHALLWLAYEKKIFQKYGLDGEYLALESGTPAMQALLANELHIVFTTGALAITAKLQGADSTIIAGGINFIPNKLLVRPHKNAARFERQTNCHQPLRFGIRLRNSSGFGKARHQSQGRDHRPDGR